MSSLKANYFKAVIGRCPVCSADLEGHSVALIATVIINDNQQAVTEFFKALQEHRWEDLRQFQQWEGASDNAEAYAIQCPQGLAWFVIRSPFELYESDTFLTQEVLDSDDSKNLRSWVPEGLWHPL